MKLTTEYEPDYDARIYHLALWYIDMEKLYDLLDHEGYIHLNEIRKTIKVYNVETAVPYEVVVRTDVDDLERLIKSRLVESIVREMMKELDND